MEKGIAGRDDRIRAAARPLLAVGLTLLLAVGAVSLASAKGSTIHANGTLSHLWLLFAFLSFAGAASAAYQLLIRRFGSERSSEAAQRFNRALIAVAAIMAVVLPAAFYLARPTAGGGNGAESCAGCVDPLPSGARPIVETAVPDYRTPRPPKGFHLGPLLMIVGITVGVLIIAIVLYFVVRMLRMQHPQPIQGYALPSQEMVDDADLERAMLAGRDALEGEARAAIIACYAAMEQSLEAAGVPLLSSDSPADLLARAAAGGLIEGGAPARLAELFREARFSTHPMNDARLTEARAALDEILAQVTARQAAAAARLAEAAAQAAAEKAEKAAASAAAPGGGRTGKR
ncbi:DUF4129 domain-containing protein [Actinospica durhamensis]|uniref:DUF4129 domain-containing protein n=1 Tax=Actinospica durhamensis TaxID=1508375 RepID=A0A941EQT6_9ACTN|nr:DUF4129 domain-containing protein [Actinospica durhamensis]MBR7835463.1 DUF4129 domain-containing protein [Actinospica durhamensis]